MRPPRSALVAESTSRASLTDGGARPGGEADDVLGDDRAPRTVLWATLAAAVVLIGLFAVLLTDGDISEGNPRVGEAAPVIRATTLDGERFDLDDHLGRWVVVNFFATWCPPCIEEHPELVEFAERHEAAGDAAVVSVTHKEPVGVIEEFFDAEGGDWPVVTDDDGRIAIDYAVLGLPESFLITPAGFVATQINGGVTADGLDALIAAFEERAAAA